MKFVQERVTYYGISVNTWPAASYHVPDLLILQRGAYRRHEANIAKTITFKIHQIYKKYIHTITEKKYILIMTVTLNIAAKKKVPIEKVMATKERREGWPI